MLFFLLALSPILLHAQAQEATLLGTWDDPPLVGSSAFDNTYNDIWGVAAGGHEYAIIGSTAGTHFIDITEPSTPFEAHFVAGKSAGAQIIHRDYHDYQGYLYAVADEGASSLQIIDLANLPAGVDVLYDSDALFERVHNIFIDSTTARLYTFSTKGGPEGHSPMRIYDLSEPLNPTFIGEYSNFGSISANSVHDGYARDNIAFLNCGNGLAIVDFSNTDNPITLSTMTSYPQAGYNHSGWTNKDCTHYYLADETHNMDIKTVEVSDYDDVEVINTFNAEASSNSSIVHNLIVACDYLYASYYYDGLQVYDIADPDNPQRVLYYDTSSEPDGFSYKGAWGVYPYLPSGNILISDMQEGLLVFEGPGDACDPNENVTSCRRTGTSTTQLESKVFGVTVFPVPANDALNLSINANELLKNTQIQLTDLTGKIVHDFGVFDFHQGENILKLNITSTISNGFYLLSVSNGGFRQVVKVVIQ